MANALLMSDKSTLRKVCDKADKTKESVKSGTPNPVTF
jgi:hypothetical protein